MSINICNEVTNDQAASIGESDRKLRSLLDEQEKWISNNYLTLPKSKYAADIGFDIRPDVNSGGINTEILRKLSNATIAIYFSEYSGTI